MNNVDLSILIAVYNEEKNIQRAIESIRGILPAAEIVVIDDGSTDRTFQLAKELESRLTKILSLEHRGKGYAIRKGIETANGKNVVQIDADLQFPAEYISILLEPIKKGKADIVFGSRYLDPAILEKGSVTLLKRLASYLLAKFISFICKQRYSDIFAGFKAWKSSVMQKIVLRENGFAYEAEIAIEGSCKGFNIIEVPVAYKARKYEASKINLFRDTLLVSLGIFRIIWRNKITNF